MDMLLGNLLKKRLQARDRVFGVVSEWLPTNWPDARKQRTASRITEELDALGLVNFTVEVEKNPDIVVDTISHKQKGEPAQTGTLE